MTGTQLTLPDCDPTWTDRQPATRTPTAADLRQAELSDLRDQHASLYGLHHAVTVPTGSYL